MKSVVAQTELFLWRYRICNWRDKLKEALLSGCVEFFIYCNFTLHRARPELADNCDFFSGSGGILFNTPSTKPSFRVFHSLSILLWRYHETFDQKHLQKKYITVHPNRTVSLSDFSFFKSLHLLIRTHRVPVLLICPLALSRVKRFFVHL